jgi:hypothetical protein
MHERAFFHAMALGALLGCGGSADTPRPRVPKIDHAELVSTREDVAVSVVLQSPMHVRWVQTTLGASKPTLGVVVVNRGAATVDVSNLRVHLDAIRESVSFHCAEEVGAASGSREPTSLAAGASFTFERTLDCALPLVGSYAIRVGVSFGHGDWSKLREVRAFNLRVFATHELEPRHVEPVPGLWGALGASNVMNGRRAGGPGRLVVALVNGGRTPLELPRFRLALRVYRVGVPVPCEDAPIELKTPPVLGVGESYHEPIDVSCLGLGVLGKYDIAGRLEIGTNGDGWQTELGRIRVEISNELPPAMPDIPSMTP